jgi:DNA-binding Lrp family transcriptional regulator
MKSAIVLINCHFPFDINILEKFKKIPAITDIYRSQGIYDLITKITSSSEEEFGEIMNDISRIDGVDATVTLTIMGKQHLIANMK